MILETQEVPSAREAGPGRRPAGTKANPNFDYPAAIHAQAERLRSLQRRLERLPAPRQALTALND